MDIVQVLVDGGAYVHVRDRELRNVLTHCTNIQLLRFFLERGVDPNTEDNTGRTALRHFCMGSGTPRRLTLSFFLSSEQDRWTSPVTAGAQL